MRMKLEILLTIDMTPEHFDSLLQEDSQTLKFLTNSVLHEIYKELHRKTRLHKSKLYEDRVCGCFSCLEVFSVDSIEEWTDEGKTALCPKCGVDAVLAGSYVSATVLETLHSLFFSNTKRGSC